MVLEHIFPEEWLERKGKYAFLLGFIYSVIGIILARALFPSDPALVAVAFTSLLMLPELYKMFSIEERKERKEKNLRHLLKDNKAFVKTYLFLFLGILLAYSLASMILPSFEVNSLFREQMEFRLNDNVAGAAADTSGLFFDLLKNNFWVLIAIFVVSLLTGDGAIFLITWNASLWGTVFGVTARNAAHITNANPFFYFIVIMIIVAPHMLLEALAYITAAISGGVISKDVLLEKFDSKRFNTVFNYNLALLFVALVLLLLGVLVETFVLENSVKYAEIVIASYG